MVTVWVDGRLVPAADARVSAFDHGFTVGDGVFETMRVTDGTPFALRRHLDRLTRSAAVLGLPPVDRAAVVAACGEVVAAAGDGPLRLRVTYTGGAGPMGTPRDGSAPTLVVAAAPLAPWPPAPTIRVAVAPWARNDRGAVAGAKTTSYAENVVALAWAREQGADEAVLGDTQGRLCEGTGTNVFVVVDGRVCTPTTATGCLAGVTRDLVLEWTDAVAADVSVAAFREAEEAFVTSTTRDVQPIAAIDGRPLRHPGPHTLKIQETFAAMAAQHLDP